MSRAKTATKRPRCEVCGCTERVPCLAEGEPCAWVVGAAMRGRFVCTACVSIAAQVKALFVDCGLPLDARRAS